MWVTILGTFLKTPGGFQFKPKTQYVTVRNRQLIILSQEDLQCAGLRSRKEQTQCFLSWFVSRYLTKEEFVRICQIKYHAANESGWLLTKNDKNKVVTVRLSSKEK